MSGMSLVSGTRYCLNPRVSPGTNSSLRAKPRPIAIPPSIWPTTPSTKTGLPTSWAATTRRTRTAPGPGVDLDLGHLRAADVHRVGLAQPEADVVGWDVGVEEALEGVRRASHRPWLGRLGQR